MLIYLSSQSDRRKAILKNLKIKFRVVPSLYRERILPACSPRDLVLKHAFGKVRNASLPRTARYVLAADTLVWRQRFYGKPRSRAEAARMLRSLSGKVHEVHTGVVLWDRKRELFFAGHERTRVSFRKLSPKAIRDYLRSVNPLDKAGAYAIQEGPRIVKSIQGSYSNVVGLPQGVVRRLLKECRKRPMIKKRKQQREK
ncbi:MAG: Maf-like protein YhdE [Candidatus Omnitrophica bacterium ADurb.Bin277]|nr:MAG: Maf-like protein YhdE [Candidatus Omnitrophica bacterium ADurb.Bin277]